MSGELIGPQIPTDEEWRERRDRAEIRYCVALEGVAQLAGELLARGPGDPAEILRDILRHELERAKELARFAEACGSFPRGWWGAHDAREVVGPAD